MVNKITFLGKAIFHGLLIIAIWLGINWYQTRNMLADDGSVKIQSIEVNDFSNELMQVSLVNNKPSLVYFFAPWSGVCRLSVPNLQSIHDNHSEQINLVVIAISYESVADVQGFIDETEIDFPVYLGSQQLQQKFKILGYPSYYLMDSSGSIKYSSIGYTSTLGLKLNTYLIN